MVHDFLSMVSWQCDMVMNTNWPGIFGVVDVFDKDVKKDERECLLKKVPTMLLISEFFTKVNSEHENMFLEWCHIIARLRTEIDYYVWWWSTRVEVRFICKQTNFSSYLMVLQKFIVGGNCITPSSWKNDHFSSNLLNIISCCLMKQPVPTK